MTPKTDAALQVATALAPQRDAGAAVIFQRAAHFAREAINREARTIEMVLSSEEPYARWWGVEVLSHQPSAVRLGRLSSGRHPLLVDHNTRDQVGVIERAWIGDDRRLRCIARFGRSARAEEIFQDVCDGIRSLVSVGYQIHELKLTKESDAGDEYMATDWEPHEGSIVAVPADPTVGIGREAELHAAHLRSLTNRTPRAQRAPAVPPIHDSTTAKDITVDKTQDTTITAPAAKVEPQATQATQSVDARRERESGAATERQRVRDIQALGDKFGQREQANAAIEAGTSYDAFRESVFSGLERSGALKLADSGEIGLSKKEVQQFRFTNLIAATMWPDDKAVRSIAGFEIACSQAAADKRSDVRADRQNAFTIPVDVLTAPLDVRSVEAEVATKMLMQRVMAAGRIGQRDLNVGTTTAGGHLVATELLASSFIDILVNAMKVMSMGTTMLSDLNGNVAIPRATGGSTGYWVAESGAPTESQQAFDQVTLSPKTCGAFVDYSRRLLLQSSIAVEAFVRMDIARTIALLIDLAAINGSGSSNQPRGVLNTSGIGSVAGGTNGAAPTWDHIVELEAALANANAPDGALGYLTNSKVRSKLKRTQVFSSTNGERIWADGRVNDQRAVVSNQVPSTLTKGSASGICSAILFGNWSDLLIGLWGGLDIMTDPYAGATSGTKRVIALQDVDVTVRYAASFASMQDALTT